MGKCINWCKPNSNEFLCGYFRVGFLVVLVVSGEWFVILDNFKGVISVMFDNTTPKGFMEKTTGSATFFAGVFITVNN